MLICTVRGCGQPLTRTGNAYSCPQKHSFDIGRHGHITLLQPQDRRSRIPGDAAEAVHARRRLSDRGLFLPLLHAIRDLAALSPADIVLDAGCGDGYYLGTLAEQTGSQGHGVDISQPAILAAARRYPHCQWVLANADRQIPYASQTFSLVLSITARRNAPEFHRVLRPGGRLLVAIPAPDDLIELRGPSRDRIPVAVADFAPYFTLAAHRRATTTADLDAAAVADVLHAIYRPLQPQPPAAGRVTFSLDLLLFQPVDAPPAQSPAASR
jgi:23S rRNA (guanine745-N1)-methyltransferase